jgi:TonB family protein
MEEEAIRVISAMPNWNAALIDGEPVGEYVNSFCFLFGKIFDINGMYTVVQKMPEYKGGTSALLQDISRNLRYPVLAQENKISGKVILQFVVTKTGSIGEVIVVRGIGSGCDEESVRVVKSLPNFIPGMINGVTIDVWYTLPISFRLEEGPNFNSFPMQNNKTNFNNSF